ncbi:TIR domain-containing protein [Bradyrhizobium betae]
MSLPADPWLPPNLNRLKWGIVDEIEKHNFVPEVFTNPRGKPGLASSRSWHPRDADEIARRCVGAALLGMARWNFNDANSQPVLLPTEFNHYEGALTRTLGLPMLVLAQRDIKRRVVFDLNFAGFVGGFDANSDVDWLHTDEFLVPFNYWLNKLRERKDVFLGYAGTSSPTAQSIKTYLKASAPRCWTGRRTSFQAGLSWTRSSRRLRGSIGGIFLFTKDDDLADPPPGIAAVPRDNVVFEAGYFIGLKGKNNVLIIRESGCKLPADLGGDIYAALPSQGNIQPIERSLTAFVESI